MSIVAQERPEGQEDDRNEKLKIEAQQRLLLYCHLCSKKHELLKGLAQVYTSLPLTAKDEIDLQLTKLIPSIGARSVPLQELLRDFILLFPDDTVAPPLDFALRVVSALTGQLPKLDVMRPREGLSDEEKKEWDAEHNRRIVENRRLALPETLIEAILQLHDESSDPRFIVCILPMLTKEDVIHYLPRIVEMDRQDAVCDAFDRTLASATPPLTPAGLLVTLHDIDPKELKVEAEGSTGLSRVIRATSLCFEGKLKKYYTKEVLASVIQQLLDNPAGLPTLFMRTVIQALAHFPDLKGFVMRILASLVLKSVWEDNSQWLGFIKCCEVGGAAAAPVLMQLPQAQLEQIITTKPALRALLESHIATINPASVPEAVASAIQSTAANA